VTEEELLCVKITTLLEGIKAKYFITGSVASMYYGDARMTRDIDIVVDLRYGDVHAIDEAFPRPEYWFDADLARAAMRDGTQAMINDTSHGLKVDLMFASESPFNSSRFRRARRVELFPHHVVNIAAPEDVILMKLRYYQLGGSDKHLRDIASMLKISRDEIDREYLGVWAKTLEVEEELLAVYEAVAGRTR
jgi:hypothetical protein